MNKEQRMVEAFHRKFGCTVNKTPTQISETLTEMRLWIMIGEMTELKKAMKEENLLKIADALADLQYGLFGTAIVYGIDLEPIFAEIHRSNMTKSPPLEADGKAIKGEGYSPPKLLEILANMIKREGKSRRA